MRLEIDGITKYFGRTVALDRVSFALEGAGIHGFVGPNGAGKTTLLRILAGLDEPDAGDARIDGVSLIEYPEKMRRRIGFMPDTLPDARDLTVGEYLDFHARAFGLRGADREKELRRVGDLTALDGLLDKTLAALSKGMKQRVSLARILIHDPELLLLDEPAAGLDPRARIELRDILLRLAAAGKTVFLSSHILSELEDMITGLVILERGKLVSAGAFGTAAPADTDAPETLILIPAAGVSAADWLAKVRAIDGVAGAESSVGGRQLVLAIRRGDFARILPEILATGFPLAALRRPELAPELERLFLDRTTGGVQ